jgi:hypothetical protein
MSGEIVNLMLTLRNQVKIYHWETMQYARHKSTDDLVDKLDDWKIRTPKANFTNRNY